LIVISSSGRILGILAETPRNPLVKLAEQMTAVRRAVPRAVSVDR
jgi:hypothetical protein